jgi:hypothetical protein
MLDKVVDLRGARFGDVHIQWLGDCGDDYAKAGNKAPSLQAAPITQ